jgi:hypothetical protein
MRSDLDDEQERGFDRDRHALAALLLSRNCQMAAKVVAVSRYSTTYVADSHYCVLLSVPPELYDTRGKECALGRPRNALTPANFGATRRSNLHKPIGLDP